MSESRLRERLADTPDSSGVCVKGTRASRVPLVTTRRDRRLVIWIAATGTFCVAGPLKAADIEDSGSRTVVLESAADSATDPEDVCDRALAGLSEEASAAGFARLAAWIEDLRLPNDGERLMVIRPGPPASAPEWLDEEATDLWERLGSLRRTHALRHVEHAANRVKGSKTARQFRIGPADPPGRTNDWDPTAAGVAADALRLAARAVWLDPENEPARSLTGWVRYDDRWVRPEAARRLSRGETYLEDFGWMPADRAARYGNGERYERGRWLSAEEADGISRTIHTGWRFTSDHWQVVSSAPPAKAAALAMTLEEAHSIWTQVFSGYALSASDVGRFLAGRGRASTIGPCDARLVASKDEYVAELERLEPTVARTLGIYWSPTRTAWFFDPGEGPDAWTVWHEAVHQLFAESRKTVPAVGERSGFWAVEAAACFVESARQTRFGWTVGGRDAGRAPMAHRRLIEDGFYVPLAEVVAMGRRDLQADPRLPRLYSQLSGLADFFMTGEHGRLRTAFVEYLGRLYDGRVEDGTLATLCGCSYEDLDDRYRRHMARELPDGEAVR